jgi:hypothetical protein
MLSFSERDSLKLLEVCDERVRQLRSACGEGRIRISLRNRGGYTNITSLFSDIFLPVELIKIVNNTESKEYERIKSIRNGAKSFRQLPEHSSITSFISDSGGLSKAISRAELLAPLMRLTNVNSYSELQLVAINFVKSILCILEAIKGIVLSDEVGRKDRELKDSRDFCALCWRLINNLNHGAYDENERRIIPKHSRFFCDKHHPNKEKAKHNCSLTALKSAVRNERTEFLLELQDVENGKFTTTEKSHIYEIWLRSFVPYVNVFENGVPESLSWQDVANIILITLKPLYTHIPEGVYRSIMLSENWNHWFMYGLIENLDPNCSSEDRLLWENFSHNDSIIDNWKNGGWQVVHHILHRYEAYQYVKNRKRPRGPNPKKNEFRALTPLKAKIKQKLISQQTSKKKLSVLEIANQIGTSPKTVYSVKKQFNL